MRFCPLFSGSSGNSTLLEALGTRLLIDAGLPARTISQALAAVDVDPSTISAILITHEHSDHINGVGAMSRKYNIPVYANAKTWQGMAEKLGNISPRNQRVFETNTDFYIKELNIIPFKTPHDAAESVGFSVSCREGRISVMTDIGHVDNRLFSAVENSDLLLIEANHDIEMLKTGCYPYPLKQRILSSTGHLSNEAAGIALSKLYLRGINNVILGHLSKENNTEPLALETVRHVLRSEDVPDSGLNIMMAHRDRPSGMYILE